MSLSCPKYSWPGCSRGLHVCIRQREPNKRCGASNVSPLEPTQDFLSHTLPQLMGSRMGSYINESLLQIVEWDPNDWIQSLFKWLHNQAQNCLFLCLFSILWLEKAEKKPVHKKRKGWTHRRLGQRRGRKPQQCSQVWFHLSFLRPGRIPALGSFAT